MRQKLAPGADGSGTSAEEAYDSWNSHNFHLLKRMFTDRTVADEAYYAGPPAKELPERFALRRLVARRPAHSPGQPETPEKLEAKTAKLRVIRDPPGGLRRAATGCGAR